MLSITNYMKSQRKFHFILHGHHSESTVCHSKDPRFNLKVTKFEISLHQPLLKNKC